MQILSIERKNRKPVSAYVLRGFLIILTLLVAACSMPEATPEPEPMVEATAPGTMAAPTLKARNGVLIAKWTAPENDGGSPITGYELQYRAVGSDKWILIDSGIDGTDHPITGLTNGTPYEVQVRAVNAQGTGGWSDKRISTPVTVPHAPNAPGLTPENSQLTVYWAAPTNNGGSDITGYELQYSSDGGTTWTLIKDSDITGTDHTIADLTNGSTYEVQVRAVNAQGAGQWSASATAMLPSFTTQLPAGTAAFAILSADIDTQIATENLVVFLTTVKPGTLMVDEVSGVMTVTPATAPADVTIPLVNRDTGLITVTAGTTAGTYLVYGKNGNEDVLFAEYFFVTESPTTNAELKTAVNAGITAWGDTGNFNYIITAAVTDMSGIFNSKTSFNGDISLWDTGAVTNMFQMFASASVFNGDISGWDVSSVTNTGSMFYFASAFTGDLENWGNHLPLNAAGQYAVDVTDMFVDSGLDANTASFTDSGDQPNYPSWYKEIIAY